MVIKSLKHLENMDSDSLNAKSCWYVLRDLKRSNAKDPAYKVLQSERYGLQDKIFTPMVQRKVKFFGKESVQWVPYMSDLLFVYENRLVLDSIIETIPTLQYRFTKGNGYNNPLIVRNEDMATFIEAVKCSERVEYIKPEEISVQMYGSRIRVIGGALSGVEGRLLKRRGKRTKSLILELPGVLSALISVEAEYIQLIDE